MCDQIKTMKNNEKTVSTFNYMTQLVGQQMNQIDTVKMAENMQMFNEKMDEIMINNKMTTELMQGNQTYDTNVDHMMDALKQELAVQDNTKIIEGGQKQQNTNYNTQNTQKMQGKV